MVGHPDMRLILQQARHPGLAGQFGECPLQKRVAWLRRRKGEAKLDQAGLVLIGQARTAGQRRRLGEKAAAPDVALQQAKALRLGIGARDCPDGDAQPIGQIAMRRQTIAGGKPAS